MELLTINDEVLEEAVRKSIDLAFKKLEACYPNKRATDLISLTELKEELHLSTNTLLKWEKAGLRRYSPPLDDSRKVFYRVSELLSFLGGDRNNNKG